MHYLPVFFPFLQGPSEGNSHLLLIPALHCLALPYHPGVFRWALIRVSFLQWYPDPMKLTTHTHIHKRNAVDPKACSWSCKIYSKETREALQKPVFNSKESGKPSHNAYLHCKDGVKWVMKRWCRYPSKKSSNVQSFLLMICKNGSHFKFCHFPTVLTAHAQTWNRLPAIPSGSNTYHWYFWMCDEACPTGPGPSRQPFTGNKNQRGMEQTWASTALAFSCMTWTSELLSSCLICIPTWQAVVITSHSLLSLRSLSRQRSSILSLSFLWWKHPHPNKVSSLHHSSRWTWGSFSTFWHKVLKPTSNHPWKTDALGKEQNSWNCVQFGVYVYFLGKKIQNYHLIFPKCSDHAFLAHVFSGRKGEHTHMGGVLWICGSKPWIPRFGVRVFWI